MDWVLWLRQAVTPICAAQALRLKHKRIPIPENLAVNPLTHIFSIKGKASG